MRDKKMNIKCPKCESLNTHRYNDCFICFNCLYKKKYYDVIQCLPEKNMNNSFNEKLSGNKGGKKRYFPGVK